MVRALLWVCLIFLTGVNLRAETLAWDAPARDAWWAEHPDPKTWRSAASDKMTELIAAYQPSDSGELSPEISGWFNLLRWVSLLSSDEFEKTGLTAAEFRAMGENEQLEKTFLDEVKSEDKLIEALKILGQLYRAYPQDVAAYPALAVAYALVFDQPFPDNWPHHQVRKLPWTEKSGTPAERFAYYVDLDKKKKLDFPLTELSFTELKFLVDSLVSLDELTWAREEVRINLKDFPDLFSTIHYDYSRLKNQQYGWPDTAPYSLQEILKRGGICVDQAYYCATVGKARGVPTLYFSGQGSDGGHAWDGYLLRNRSWDLDMGRYANQNYAVGHALDPQTWDEVNDAQLKQFSEVVLQNSHYPEAKELFTWARSNRDQPFYPAALEQVRTLVPTWIQGWRAGAEWMKKTQQPLEVQKEFYRQWSQQFLKYPDYKVEGQSRLLEVLTAAGDTEGAKQLQAEIVRQNRKKRFDLGIDAAAEPILDLLDKQDWKGAETEYKKMVRQFESKGGGNLFQGVVSPFVLTCLEDGQYDLAKDSLEFAQKKMKPDPVGILGVEFADLAKKIEEEKKGKK